MSSTISGFNNNSAERITDGKPGGMISSVVDDQFNHNSGGWHTAP
jgi:hypothetical protein